MQVSKLSVNLQYGCNKRVYKPPQDQLREPELSDLTLFVDKATNLASDPLFLREGLNNYVSSKIGQTDRRRRSIKIFLTRTYEGGKRIGQKSCVYCKECHDIERCSRYFQLSVAEQSKVIFKSKLCYACLNFISKKNTAKNCKVRR